MSLIEEKLDAIGEAHCEMLALLGNVSEEASATQPADGWSIRQVIGHLLFSETGTLGYMQKKSSSGWDALEETGQEQSDSSAALNTRLASNERYKAPSVLPEPGNDVSLAELLQRWEASQIAIREFALGVEEKYYNKLVFRQPLAGMLNLIQTLEFVAHHIRHHLPQVKRLLDK